MNSNLYLSDGSLFVNEEETEMNAKGEMEHK